MPVTEPFRQFAGYAYFTKIQSSSPLFKGGDRPQIRCTFSTKGFKASSVSVWSRGYYANQPARQQADWTKIFLEERRRIFVEALPFIGYHHCGSFVPSGWSLSAHWLIRIKLGYFWNLSAVFISWSGCNRRQRHLPDFAVFMSAMDFIRITDGYLVFGFFFKRAPLQL